MDTPEKLGKFDTKSNCMNWTDPEIYRRKTGTCPECVLKHVTIIGNTHYAQ
jgi:hypothetical protein